MVGTPDLDLLRLSKRDVIVTSTNESAARRSSHVADVRAYRTIRSHNSPGWGRRETWNQSKTRTRNERARCGAGAALDSNRIAGFAARAVPAPSPSRLASFRAPQKTTQAKLWKPTDRTHQCAYIVDCPGRSAGSAAGCCRLLPGRSCAAAGLSRQASMRGRRRSALQLPIWLQWSHIRLVYGPFHSSAKHE